MEADAAVFEGRGLVCWTTGELGGTGGLSEEVGIYERLNLTAGGFARLDRDKPGFTARGLARLDVLEAALGSSVVSGE